jgi:aryl-alcohol dehydrogenase-like predicted oxidoreductase
MGLSRRRFLAASAAVAGAGLSGLGAGSVSAAERKEILARPMPQRPFGRTGLKVGVITMGTHPVGRIKDEKTAVGVIRRAIDLGVTYLDTAPSYSKHRAERWVGKAAKGRRDGVLIGTKSYVATKKGALAELEKSLKALGTDHVDVFQIHAVGNAGDRDRKLDAEKGTLAAAIQAKKDGKCRFIGVTGHADPRVMASCLDTFAFDTILVPVNCADPLHQSFVKHTLPKAKAKRVAVIAMKVFAAGKLVAGKEPRAAVAECVRYALSQDIATASVGARSIAELEADVLAAKSFAALSAKQQAALTRRQAPHPGKSLEWYKRDD